MARILRGAGLAAVLLTVAAGPYFQGLFFPFQQHVAETAVAAGFLLWAIGRQREGRRIPWLTGGVEGAALALLGCYLLASLAAVYPQGHLNVVLQVVAGLLVFYLVRAEQQAAPAFGRRLAWLLVAASAGVALIGLAPYVGMAPFVTLSESAQRLWGTKARLASTFEYPNTYAAYIVAMWVILAGLAAGARRRFLVLPLAGVLGFLYGLTFLLAASRGALLVLPVAAVLLPLALPRGQRLAGLLFLGATLAPALAALKGVDGNAALSDWFRVWKWLAAGGAAAAAGGGALALWLALPPRWRGALAGAAGALVLAGCVGAVGRYGSFTAVATKALPPKVQRLLAIHWEDNNVVLRLIYDQDALRMIQDRPLLGAGGRGWDRLYPQYQEFRYVASETHNHFAQVAVEAGLPGLLAFVAFWAALAWHGWRQRESGAPGPVLAAAALTMGAHSLIDFNLSYLSVWLTVFALAGAASASPEAARPLAIRPLRAGAAAGLLLLAAAPQALGGHYLREGARLVQAGARPEAVPLLEKAARLLPLAPEPWAGLALARAGQPEELHALRQAAARDPLNPEWPHRLYITLERREDWPAAYAAAREALRLQPTLGEYYENALNAGVQVAVKAVLSGDAAGARRLVAEAGALVEQLAAQQRRAEPNRHRWSLAYPDDTPLLHLRAGQALALAGEYGRALPRLREAQKQTALLSEAEIWTYLIYEQQGDEAGKQRLARRPWILALRVNPLAPVLRQAAQLQR